MKGTSGTGTFSQKIAKRLNFLKGSQSHSPSQDEWLSDFLRNELIGDETDVVLIVF